ncbi:Cobyrinic acid A,C-diamide synthase [hydrothermal vent metagenome]|uniref:Cobyrinic acid A,C-diamide synthase n=1 Tax=hydrothermal vent metagenome TaxID=652676 RepID=A0A1W1BLV5_9ZZZZ
MSIYISAAHKSSGKTTISLGLCAIFQAQGLKVQSFKKGPDYIDPLWLSQASKNPCFNLDFWNMNQDEISNLFKKYQATADISIVEGNKGLYDGVNIHGGDSNADLAKQLNLPVILVIDVSGITRGVAPLLKGYQLFDEQVNIAGVILNKAVGQRHSSKVRQAVEYYTDIPVLGVISKNKNMLIKERHLGLIPENEIGQSQILIDSIRKQLSEEVDYQKILEINHQVKGYAKVEENNIKVSEKTVKIAVAKDSAFGFYYNDDIVAFEKYGAELVFFDALLDDKLPKVDALFIGGGFPEMVAKELSKNILLKQDIKQKIEQGLPTYAECGGLMYLTNSISIKDKLYPMVGVIDANTIMLDKPVGRGYVELEMYDNYLWGESKKIIKAHEFHYSKLEKLNKKYKFIYKVKRGFGVDGKNDGLITYNLLASYSHLRNVDGYQWIKYFIKFIKDKRNDRNN